MESLCHPCDDVRKQLVRWCGTESPWNHGPPGRVQIDIDHLPYCLFVFLAGASSLRLSPWGGFCLDHMSRTARPNHPLRSRSRSPIMPISEQQQCCCCFFFFSCRHTLSLSLFFHSLLLSSPSLPLTSLQFLRLRCASSCVAPSDPTGRNTCEGGGRGRERKRKNERGREWGSVLAYYQEFV